MEVAMAYGVPAMALYILWLAALAMRSLKVGLSLREEQPMTGPILAVLLLVMVVNNLAEATLLFYRYFNGSVFFLTAGYICGLPAKPWFRRGS